MKRTEICSHKAGGRALDTMGSFSQHVRRPLSGALQSMKTRFAKSPHEHQCPEQTLCIHHVQPSIDNKILASKRPEILEVQQQTHQQVSNLLSREVPHRQPINKMICCRSGLLCQGRTVGSVDTVAARCTIPTSAKLWTALVHSGVHGEDATTFSVSWTRCSNHLMEA